MTTTGAHASRRPGRAHLVPAPVRACAQVLLWMVILGFSAALAAGVLVPRVAGATPYTILTGSMTPTYPPGTLVVDKPTDPAAIGVGTVVTYQIESGKPAVVTHRVIAVNTTVNGELTYTTQGDANPTPDSKPVRPEQIRGQLWYAVPHLGRAGVLFSGHQRELFTYGIAGGLGLYALTMFSGAARDRRRTPRTTSTTSTTTDATTPTPVHSEKEQDLCVT